MRTAISKRDRYPRRSGPMSVRKLHSEMGRFPFRNGLCILDVFCIPGRVWKSWMGFAIGNPGWDLSLGILDGSQILDGPQRASHVSRKLSQSSLETHPEWQSPSGTAKPIRNGKAHPEWQSPSRMSTPLHECGTRPGMQNPSWMQKPFPKELLIRNAFCVSK